ncbi:MAG: DUF3105 domain-containing protein [Mycobacterium sp.]|nr:DUF3105 domain-containing protein [Mycobacterium sp.]
MAQRRSPSRPSTAGKSSGKPPTKSTRTAPARPSTATGARPVKRKPGKSIVNQKQRPWGIIATVVVLVLVAGGIIAYAVTRNGGSGSNNHVTVSRGGQPVDPHDRWRLPELPAAKKIPGVSYRVEGEHNHVQGNIKYDSTPPRGGLHSQYWADCTGTVYPQAIANENAVHMLEHGAVWVTYNPKTATAQDIATLKKDVEGVNYTAMSPYPNLKTPISLQAWGYQLFVQKASDPRVQQFISTLRLNKDTTPEQNASCSDPSFKTHPSTFGHPLWVPASGTGGTVP